MSAADIPEPVRTALGHPEAARRLLVEVLEGYAAASASERAGEEPTLQLLGHAAAALGALDAVPPALDAAAALGAGGAEGAAVLARAALAAESVAPDGSWVKAGLGLEAPARASPAASYRVALLVHALAEVGGRAWLPKLRAAYDRLVAHPELSAGERRLLASLPPLGAGAR